MKVLAAIAGPISAKEKADYIINIAKRLRADLIVLHVVKRENQAKKGEDALKYFSEAGKKAKVKVKKILKKAEIVSAIIETAEAEKADLIIMGADRGKVVAEWLSEDVMRKTKIPAVVIPHELKNV